MEWSALLTINLDGRSGPFFDWRPAAVSVHAVQVSEANDLQRAHLDGTDLVIGRWIFGEEDHVGTLTPDHQVSRFHAASARVFSPKLGAVASIA